MARKGKSTEEIIGFLREAEVWLGQVEYSRRSTRLRCSSSDGDGTIVPSGRTPRSAIGRQRPTPALIIH